MFLTGGDPGDGLALNAANVVGAMNANGSAQAWQGVNFVADSTGIFSTTGNSYGGSIDFGGVDTSEDDALEVIASSLRWNAPGGVDLTISSLTPNADYRLDLIQSTGSANGREQAVLISNVFQEIVLLSNAADSVAVTTLTTTANGSGQIFVQFRASGDYGGTGHQEGAVFSGVVVSNAVPEPSSFVLAGLGLMGLGWFGLRPRKAGK